MRARVVFALVLALMAGACGARVATDDDVARPTTTPSTIEATTSTTAEQAGWRPIAPVPDDIELATQPPPIWTGEIAIFSAFRAGKPAHAAYAPATDAWSAIPDPPGGPRVGSADAWTGAELVVWGGQARSGNESVASGAAYDPKTQQWRRIKDAPFARSWAVAVKTGRELLVWGGFPGPGQPIDSTIHDKQAALYDPTANTWKSIADLPDGIHGDGGTAITDVAGGHVLVYRAGKVTRFDEATGTWTAPGAHDEGPKPQSLLTGDPRSVGAAVGTRLVVWQTWGADPPRGWSFDTTTSKWKSVADRDVGSYAGLASDGVGLYVWPGYRFTPEGGAKPTTDLSRYNPDTDAWETVPRSPLSSRSLASVVWTGTELIVAGGSPTDTDGGAASFHDAAAYHP